MTLSNPKEAIERLTQLRRYLKQVAKTSRSAEFHKDVEALDALIADHGRLAGEAERLKEPDERFRAMFHLDVERGEAVKQAQRRAEAAEARSQPLQEQREARRVRIAQIIDPDAWCNEDGHLIAYVGADEALAKADAILNDEGVRS